MSRIAVVGAGVGGLAVAARLAKMGHSVTLYEQASTVGGKLGWLEVDGFRFDTGPSIVTFPEVFRNLWSFLGEAATFDVEAGLRRLDPIARYRFADGTWFDAAADDIAFYRNIEQLRPGNADEMRRFFDRAGRIWNATRVPFLESPLRGLRNAREVGDHPRPRPSNHCAVDDDSEPCEGRTERPEARLVHRPLRDVHRLRPSGGTGGIVVDSVP